MKNGLKKMNKTCFRAADEERSAGARRPAGELNNDDVSNQQEATAQTSSWYWKLAIAKRCRLNKSIRQCFAFTLKIQQMACAMIKPAGSHSYLESAGAVVSYWTAKPALTNKEFNSWTFSKANPTADDLAKQFQQQRFSSNDQAVTIQQQRKFSRGDFIFSTKKLEFLDAKQYFCTGNFTSESRRDLSRVQGRFRAITVELRENSPHHFEIHSETSDKLPRYFEILSQKNIRILSQSSAQATNQQVRDLGRIRAIELLPDFVQTAGFVLPAFRLRSVHVKSNFEYKNEEQVEEEEQEQFWGW
ncbi:hypothetical protein F511_17148 [Dorcoceras hygrometricum]|uniref:Uncharacterized protein n=1 Tax=Dorcoceras hygrometricum TaxID=472368 RepID=A0A2Z7C5N1_9LAMI|nr:hypothetical protein F511_17148 [Dorcoceras hygrometricum]